MALGSFPGLSRQLDELESRLRESRSGPDSKGLAPGTSPPQGREGAGSGLQPPARDPGRSTRRDPTVPSEAGRDRPPQDPVGTLETAIRELTARMATTSKGASVERRARDHLTRNIPAPDANSALAVGPPMPGKPCRGEDTEARPAGLINDDQAMARIHEARLVDLVSQQVRSTFRELAARLDASFAETLVLKDMVAALGGKVETLLQGDVADRMTEEFSREMARIADRLDQADRGIMSLNSLEKTIEGLLEGFVALAAPGGTPAGLDPSPRLLQSEPNLAQEIAAMRTMQEETRRRFDAALAGFAESLSRVETALGGPSPVRSHSALDAAPARVRPRRPGQHVAGAGRTDSAPPETPRKLMEAPATRLAGEARPPVKQREPDETLIEPGGGFPQTGEPATKAGEGDAARIDDPAPGNSTDPGAGTACWDPSAVEPMEIKPGLLPAGGGAVERAGKTGKVPLSCRLLLAGAGALLLAIGFLALARLAGE